MKLVTINNINIFKRASDACKNLVNKSIQALTTRSATQFIDAKGLNNVEMVGSNAVYLNGSDNLINLGEDNSFLNDFRIDLYLKIEVLGEYPILINDINGKGWYIRTSASNGRLVIYSNNTGIYASVSSICNNTLNHIIISYVDSTSILTTEIVGVENNDYTIAQPTFTSNPITKIGVDKVGSYNLKATVCGFDIYDNANGSGNATFSLPFAEGDGTAVYDVMNDTAYAIGGTVNTSTRVLIDGVNINLENGCTISGSTYIPASKLHIGKDVLGNDLTNPAIENWHNGAETKLQQINDTLRSYDTNFFWWDSSGNKKQVPFADLKSSADGKISINVVDADKQRGMFFMFENAPTTTERKMIDKCFLKSQILPTGYEYVIDEVTGEYATDEVTGEYTIDLIQ